MEDIKFAEWAEKIKLRWIYRCHGLIYRNIFWNFFKFWRVVSFYEAVIWIQNGIFGVKKKDRTFLEDSKNVKLAKTKLNLVEFMDGLDTIIETKLRDLMKNRNKKCRKSFIEIYFEIFSNFVEYTPFIKLLFEPNLVLISNTPIVL